MPKNQNKTYFLYSPFQEAVLDMLVQNYRVNQERRRHRVQKAGAPNQRMAKGILIMAMKGDPWMASSYSHVPHDGILIKDGPHV